MLEKYDVRAEIAFFGGSFTAIPREKMTALMDVAAEYMRAYPHIFDGMRCSTRPDAISDEVLDLLEKAGMTAIELGAQSMCDEVLQKNKRGHSAEEVRRAAGAIRARGFELGLQMMTGLYGDTVEACRYTCEEFLALRPDTVRIYPTVILPGTRLAELFQRGEYTSFSEEETMELCAWLYGRFTENGVRVIRLGLNAAERIGSERLGGVYSPAFGELCMGRYYFHKLLAAMRTCGGRHFILRADKAHISKINGHKGGNKAQLSALGYTYALTEEPGVAPQIFINNTNRWMNVF